MERNFLAKRGGNREENKRCFGRVGAAGPPALGPQSQVATGGQHRGQLRSGCQHRGQLMEASGQHRGQR